MIFSMPGIDALEDTRREPKIELIHPKEEEKNIPLRPGLAMVVAAARDGAIGRRGGMIWHLPGDLRFFKRLTMGGVVVMGRRTWQSLPKGALPGRRNVVVSRDKSFVAPGADVFDSLEEALDSLASSPRVFIIGGGTLYEACLPLARTIYLTRIDAECEDADTFFPHLDVEEWHLQESSPTEYAPDGTSYHFETWTRR